MSSEIGTATNYQDLLNKLNTFLTTKGKAHDPSFVGTGNGLISAWDGGASSVAETFTLTATDPTTFSVVGSISGNIGTATVGTTFTHAKLTFLISAGGIAFVAGDAFQINTASPWVSKRAVAGDEMIWMAKGNDDAHEIYVGAKVFSDVGGDYYNWRLGGFTGFNSGNTFFNQPGAIEGDSIPSPITTLWNSTIPYWFVANGNRVIMFAKVSSVYASMHLGFLSAYVSPGQWPYPLFVGGNMAFTTEPAVGSARWKFSNTDYGMHSFWRGSVYPGGAGWTASSGRFRDPGGRWFGCTYESGYTDGNNYSASLWPYCTNDYGLLYLRENLDGTYPLLPISISSNNGPVLNVDVNTWGEFDGLKATTGQANASENTITEGFLTHVVFQDVYNTAKDAFCALALD
jgi:hypothetical protein